MLKINESITYADDPLFTNVYHSTDTFHMSKYDSKKTILSFIEINNGWKWLKSLVKMQIFLNSYSSNVQIIAIVFKSTSGLLDADTVVTKISNDSDFTGINISSISNFMIATDLLSGATYNKYATIYGNYICNDTPSFHQPAGWGGAMVSYVAINGIISDKWHTLCTSSLDPISFNKLQTGSRLLLTPSGLAEGANTLTFSNITGHNGTPINCTISINKNSGTYTYSVTTADSRIISFSPPNGAHTSVKPIEIIFSEQINNADQEASYSLSGMTGLTISYESYASFNSASETSGYFPNTEYYALKRLLNLLSPPTILYAEPADGLVINNISLINTVKVAFSKPVVDAAGTGSNYTPGGVGGSLLTIGASYAGAGKVENTATLTIGGTLSDGAVTITLSPAITDTEGNPLADSSISYTADVTSPKVVSVLANPHLEK